VTVLHRPFNGNLTTENTALIIIDMQQDFVGPAGYVAKMYGDQVNILRKVG
jgi:nicotinamidase-related amidase